MSNAAFVAAGTALALVLVGTGALALVPAASTPAQKFWLLGVAFGCAVGSVLGWFTAWVAP